MGKNQNLIFFPTLRNILNKVVKAFTSTFLSNSPHILVFREPPLPSLPPSPPSPPSPPIKKIEFFSELL